MVGMIHHQEGKKNQMIMITIKLKKVLKDLMIQQVKTVMRTAIIKMKRMNQNHPVL